MAEKHPHILDDPHNKEALGLAKTRLGMVPRQIARGKPTPYPRQNRRR